MSSAIPYLKIKHRHACYLSPPIVYHTIRLLSRVIFAVPLHCLTYCTLNSSVSLPALAILLTKTETDVISDTALKRERTRLLPVSTDSLSHNTTFVKSFLLSLSIVLRIARWITPSPFPLASSPFRRASGGKPLPVPGARVQIRRSQRKTKDTLLGVFCFWRRRRDLKQSPLVEIVASGAFA